MSRSQRWVHDVRSLRDFISYVIVHAPDEFPQEDYLQAHEQMNLASAFDELSRGIVLLQPSQIQQSELQTVLSKAFTEYKAGSNIKAAHTLHEFESLVKSFRV